MGLASTLALLLCITSTSYAADTPAAPKPLAEPTICKSVCVSARQNCRSEAQSDSSPFLSMKQDRNPYAKTAQDMNPPAQQQRFTEAEAFRARRAERLQACETPYRSCTRACG